MNKFISILILLLTIITAAISTAVTIIPISMEFKGNTQFVATTMFAVLQITMFLIALVKFNVKKYTPQHYVFIVRIQRLLLIISILGTMSFFNMSRSHLTENKDTVMSLLKIVPFIDRAPFYTWLVDNTVYFGYIALICILLDVVSLRMPSVAYDLFFGLKDDAKINTFWSKLWAICTYKFVESVNSKYAMITELKSPNAEKPDAIKSLKEPGEVKHEPKNEPDPEPEPTAMDPLAQIKMLIKNGPEIIESSKIKEKYNISKKDWSNITNELIKCGLVEKTGTKFKRAI